MRSAIAKTRIGWLIFLLLGPLAAQPAAPGPDAEALVYRITRAGTPVGFLVGTMHSEDPRVTALLDQIAPLVDQVEVVAIEMVPDAVTLLAVAAASLLPPEQSLSDRIGQQRFHALVAAGQRLGLDGSLFDRLKPWAAAVTLGMPAARTGRFLDMEIYLRALQRSRRVVGLERAAEQFAVFDQMPQGLQLALLDQMVKNADRLPKQLETLTVAYLAGDLALLDRVARAQYAGMPPTLVRWFEQELLTKRNRRLLRRAAVLLQDNRVLIAVGAMHLGGETGLVEALRRQGYTVGRWRD